MAHPGQPGPGASPAGIRLVARAMRGRPTWAMDLPHADATAAATRIWAGLDEPWRVAFAQAWEALRTGNIAVGACASTPDGQIVHAARNRVNDRDAPPGEAFGSALAHAEVNVLARLPFRGRRDLVLTTTLQPCLQCAAAIRLGPVATVRFAGADHYWDGCHDFARLSAREARRASRRGSGRAPTARHLRHLDIPAHPPPARLRGGTARPGRRADGRPRARDERRRRGRAPRHHGRHRRLAYLWPRLAGLAEAPPA